MYRYLSYQFRSDEEPILDLIKKESSLCLDPIADYTTVRTYSRNKLDSRGEPVSREDKNDIYRRVVQGTFSILENRLRNIGTYHKYEETIRQMAIQMYKSMWERKITPPGRGLWAMGTKLVNHDMMGFPLINCTFITSRNIDKIKWEFFHYVMDTLMLGVGVGYDTKGTGKITFSIPTRSNFVRYNDFYKLIDQLSTFQDTNFAPPGDKSYISYEIDYINSLESSHANRYTVHKIEDSRKGWCEALCMLLKSYMMPNQYFIAFDYSDIRPAGTLLKTFGGKSSGPKPLAELLSVVRYIMQEKYIGKRIDELFIIDVCNIIARTVVAGNVRRSSQICLSEDANIIECKRYTDPRYNYRSHWGWASNNSVTIENELTKPKLEMIMKTITLCGEPGIHFLGNSRKYGRIIDGINNIDIDSEGTNPCGEITLVGTCDKIASSVAYSAGGETCNLVETMPSNYKFDFSRTDIDWKHLFMAIHNQTYRDSRYREHMNKLQEMLKPYSDDIYIAHLYAKIVTLVPLHWKSSQHIQEMNRRIGVSMTGIAVLLSQMGIIGDDQASNIECIADGMINEQSLTFMKFAVFLDYMYNIVEKNDEDISDMIKIPKSIKKRTIKPSGTVSICNGVPAGMHFPYSRYYIRRIRTNICETELIDSYRKAGYRVENVPNNPNTVAIVFPVKMSDDVIPRDEVNVDLQFKILYYLQYYWSDNQVSCTITFREHEVARLEELIWRYRDTLKGVSCFPYSDEDKYIKDKIAEMGKPTEDARREVYMCMPNERITEDEYNILMSNIRPINSSNDVTDEDESDMYCDGDSCIRITHK